EIEHADSTHRRHWLGDLASVRGVAGGEFVRGMLRLKLSPSIVADGRLEWMTGLPDWSWGDGLTCIGAGGHRAVGELVRSPGLAGLRHLSLEEAKVQYTDVERLTENPAIADLLTLDLSDSQLYQSTLGALARSPYLSGLRQLIVTGKVSLGPFPRSIL